MAHETHVRVARLAHVSWTARPVSASLLAPQQPSTPSAVARVRTSPRASAPVSSSRGSVLPARDPPMFRARTERVRLVRDICILLRAGVEDGRRVWRVGWFRGCNRIYKLSLLSWKSYTFICSNLVQKKSTQTNTLPSSRLLKAFIYRATRNCNFNP